MGKRLRRMFGGAALFSAMMACLLFLHSHLSPGPPPGMSSERMAEVAAVEAGCVFTCISVCHQDPPAFCFRIHSSICLPPLLLQCCRSLYTVQSTAVGRWG